jgi:hypothetical protein
VREELIHSPNAKHTEKRLPQSNLLLIDKMFRIMSLREYEVPKQSHALAVCSRTSYLSIIQSVPLKCIVLTFLLKIRKL